MKQRTLEDWLQMRMQDRALRLAAWRFTITHFGGDPVRAAAYFAELAKDET